MIPRHAFSQVVLPSQGGGQRIPQAASCLPQGGVAPFGSWKEELEDWNSYFTQPTWSSSPQMRKNVVGTPVLSPPPTCRPWILREDWKTPAQPRDSGP